jgi:enhancing lycopene biosynthesis protein 2
MAPTIIAQVFKNSAVKPVITMGSTKEKSPYDIESINQGIATLGLQTVDKTIDQIQVDEKLKIVTAPSYMMEANILQVRNNIKMAVGATVKLAKS